MTWRAGSGQGHAASSKHNAPYPAYPPGFRMAYCCCNKVARRLFSK